MLVLSCLVLKSSTSSQDSKLFSTGSHNRYWYSEKGWKHPSAQVFPTIKRQDLHLGSNSNLSSLSFLKNVSLFSWSTILTFNLSSSVWFEKIPLNRVFFWQKS